MTSDVGLDSYTGIGPYRITPSKSKTNSTSDVGLDFSYTGIIDADGWYPLPFRESTIAPVRDATCFVIDTATDNISSAQGWAIFAMFFEVAKRRAIITVISVSEGIPAFLAEVDG